MYLIIDNYDSFTYNLYQYLSELTTEPVEVRRNDEISVEEIRAMQPAGIIISPGPGRPAEAGVSVEAIREFAGSVPILGVCLGHQAIGCAFGGRIVSARNIVHGKAEEMTLDGRGLFRNCPTRAEFTRYHSLVLDGSSLPPELQITARSDDDEIMGVRHTTHVVEGIQFHPESIASEYGKKIIANFLRYRREPFPLTHMLTTLTRLEDLSPVQAEGFMEEMTEGELTSAQIAAVLALLNAKGVQPVELAGFARVLRAKKRSLPDHGRQGLLDTCGTGGDGLGTFNISSMAALVAAACGQPVAKHGNRGVSSPSGSADFYRELGVPVDQSPEQSAHMLEQTGFCFLFAPLYHSAMRHAAEPRKQLGIKTAMNLVGPLSNPADASYQLIGVYDGALQGPVARAARLLGVERVLVVHGRDGQDEVSVSGVTDIVEIMEDGKERSYEVTPATFGAESYSLQELRGGSAAQNAQTARSLLGIDHGEPPRSAIRDSVLVNAGAALYVAGRADDLATGYRMAREALESGAVRDKLQQITSPETGQ